MNKDIISIYPNEREKSMSKTYISESDKKTKKIAETLAEEIMERKEKTVVIGLEGDLGGGKTTFLQGFAKGLGVKEKILSPTFVIMKKFEIRNPKSGFKNFYHVDCYRLKNSKEILALGFGKIIKKPGNIAAVEWSDIIKEILPKDAISIKFFFINNKKRKITVSR